MLKHSQVLLLCSQPHCYPQLHSLPEACWWLEWGQKLLLETESLAMSLVSNWGATFLPYSCFSVPLPLICVRKVSYDSDRYLTMIWRHSGLFQPSLIWCILWSMFLGEYRQAYTLQVSSSSVCGLLTCPHWAFEISALGLGWDVAAMEIIVHEETLLACI